MAETVRGREVTIHFDGKRCVHSRNCVLSHPEVFVPNVKGAWIHPDAAPADEVIRIGQMCPSGAIRVDRNEGRPVESSEQVPVVNTLRVRENGPLAIEAEMTLRGVPHDRVRAMLCRCGQSQRKPFCDGSHTAAEFVATGEPAGKPFEALEVRNGPVDITPLPNGSLKITGNLELVSGTGRTFDKVTKVFLCRCGQSKNKPYCDNSHKAAGFLAD